MRSPHDTRWIPVCARWEYGRRLREAGVAVHEEIVPGAFHAFDQVADRAPILLKFFASQCDHLRKALA